MKTKMPSAIVYGWYKHGHEIIESDVYWEEGLIDECHIYSLPFPEDVNQDYSKYRPDLIISIGKEIEVTNEQLKKIYIHHPEIYPDNVLANVIVCQTVFRSCQIPRPRFSMFTSTYKTGERLIRTYQSLAKQTLEDWEWVIVDDSPDEETWKMIKELARNDFRIKPHKIYPLSGGNIGLVKHRAAMLCEGEWLVELDHDDTLTSDCLQTCWDAYEQYPDGGFIYTNCCELYEDGRWKTYDHDWESPWYARHDNYFDFGYAGHSWEMVDGQKILAHNYPDVNPITIRFNISMPNHARMWKREVYHKINGHNVRTPVADDLEIIIKTFLETRFIHVKKVLYFQYNNNNSTTDNNSTDINRRARLIRDYYDLRIHQRIHELGFEDWFWIEEEGTSHKFQNRGGPRRYYEHEQVMNYIYEKQKDENLYEFDGGQ